MKPLRLPRLRLPVIKLQRIRIHPDIALLLIFLSGLGLLCLGLYFVYPPLAPIAAGVVLMAITLVGDRKTP